MGKLMDHDAHTLYCLMIKHNGAELGGFQTYPQTVQLLVQTCEYDRRLECAFDALEKMRMLSNEKIED